MKILINRTDAIGDVILTMPVIYAIKEKFPEAKIYFLVSPRTADLFKHNTFVDSVFVYNPNTSLFLKCRFLFDLFKKNKFSHYLFFGGKHLPGLFALICKVPWRGGLLSKWKSFLVLNFGVRQKRSDVLMHESDYNLGLLKPLGIDLLQDVDNFYKCTRIKYFPKLFVDEAEVQQDFLAFLKNTFLTINDVQKLKNTKFIFLHPGMTGHTLGISMKKYAELAEYIVRFEFVQLIVSYTPSDKKYIDQFIYECKKLFSEKNVSEKFEKIIFFNGAENGLNFFKNILSKASLFIGPSTGTTHMAHVLNIPVIAFYSPIKVQSVKRWGPYNYLNSSDVQIFTPKEACNEKFKCLYSLSLDQNSKCKIFCMDTIDMNGPKAFIGKILN